MPCKPTRQQLLEQVRKLKASLKDLWETQYQIVGERPEESKECPHEYNDWEWELTSDSGIAFCDWLCTQCGLKVSQTIGERLRPEKICARALVRSTGRSE